MAGAGVSAAFQANRAAKRMVVQKNRAARRLAVGKVMRVTSVFLDKDNTAFPGGQGLGRLLSNCGECDKIIMALPENGRRLAPTARHFSQSWHFPGGLTYF